MTVIPCFEAFDFFRSDGDGMHPDDLDHRPGFLAHMPLVDQAKQRMGRLTVSDENNVPCVAKLNEVIPNVQKNVDCEFSGVVNIARCTVRHVRLQASFEIAGDREHVEVIDVNHSKALLFCPVEEEDAAVHQVAAFVVGYRAIGEVCFETHVSHVMRKDNDGIEGGVEQALAAVDLGNCVIFAILVSKTVFAHLVPVP